ncbi:MAG TPA: tRNA (adenosine(37)-N6)-threonylcarbamoyltransferase complex ATPase subunit type 1 TsaE, partial [Casimicrobiaceae bacterium]
FSRLYFYHFDFYRFADPSEWETAGLAEYFRDDAVCLVEWPERVEGFLPPADIDIALAHPGSRGSGRDLVLSTHTEAGERCQDAITLALTQSPTAR